MSLAFSQLRQERWLTGIELHVEGGEKRSCPGVIAHKSDEIDQRAAAEMSHGPGEGSRRHLPRTENLAAQLDNDRVGLVQPTRAPAVLDDFDDLTRNALAERRGLVRCALKLTIELTGGSENGQFANASSNPASYRR